MMWRFTGRGRHGVVPVAMHLAIQLQLLHCSSWCQQSIFAAAHCVQEGSSTCYTDNRKSRTLGGFISLSNGDMTRAGCMTLCDEAGKKLAGVENGNQCMCGDSVPAATKHSSKCTRECSGCGSENCEICGGVWAIDIMNFSCAGPPDPTPQPGPAPDLVNPCLDKSAEYAKQPWCNASLPVDKRVADMLSRMTLAEKLGSWSSAAVAIPSLGLPEYKWWAEATHGIAHVDYAPPTPQASNFAFPAGAPESIITWGARIVHQPVL